MQVEVAAKKLFAVVTKYKGIVTRFVIRKHFPQFKLNSLQSWHELLIDLLNANIEEAKPAIAFDQTTDILFVKMREALEDSLYNTDLLPEILADKVKVETLYESDRAASIKVKIDGSEIGKAVYFAAESKFASNTPTSVTGVPTDNLQQVSNKIVYSNGAIAKVIDSYLSLTAPSSLTWSQPTYKAPYSNLELDGSYIGQINYNQLTNRWQAKSPIPHKAGTEHYRLEQAVGRLITDAELPPITPLTPTESIATLLHDYLKNHPRVGLTFDCDRVVDPTTKTQQEYFNCYIGFIKIGQLTYNASNQKYLCSTNGRTYTHHAAAKEAFEEMMAR